MPEARTIGPRIRMYRESIGKTVAECARAIGVNAGYLSKVERAKADPSEIFIAAAVLRLGLSEEWLRKGVGNPRVPQATVALRLSEISPEQAAAEEALRRIWQHGTEQQRSAVQGVLAVADPGEKPGLEQHPPGPPQGLPVDLYGLVDELLSRGVSAQGVRTVLETTLERHNTARDWREVQDAAEARRRASEATGPAAPPQRRPPAERPPVDEA